MFSFNGLNAIVVYRSIVSLWRDTGTADGSPKMKISLCVRVSSCLKIYPPTYIGPLLGIFVTQIFMYLYLGTLRCDYLTDTFVSKIHQFGNAFSGFTVCPKFQDEPVAIFKECRFNRHPETTRVIPLDFLHQMVRENIVCVLIRFFFHVSISKYDGRLCRCRIAMRGSGIV